MADFFTPEDLQQLLAGKHVVFMGDSVMRAIYKVDEKIHKVNRCLARYSPRATTTNQMSRQGLAQNASFGPNLAIFGPKIQFFGGRE